MKDFQRYLKKSKDILLKCKWEEFNQINNNLLTLLNQHNHNQYNLILNQLLNLIQLCLINKVLKRKRNNKNKDSRNKNRRIRKKLFKIKMKRRQCHNLLFNLIRNHQKKNSLKNNNLKKNNLPNKFLKKSSLLKNLQRKTVSQIINKIIIFHLDNFKTTQLKDFQI